MSETTEGKTKGGGARGERAPWRLETDGGTLAPRSALDALVVLDGRVSGGDLREYQPVPLGFGTLDKTLSGGLRPGELLLVGGAQGTGKTTMTLQMARNVAASGAASALYVCFEHDEQYLLDRLIAMESALPTIGPKPDGVKIQEVRREILAASAAAVLALSACSSSATGESGGDITLSYAIWDENQKPAMEDIAAASTAEHPHVTLEIPVTPYKEYFTKLQTAVTGGSAADVFWMNGPNFQLYASNGQLAPLDDVETIRVVVACAVQEPHVDRSLGVQCAHRAPHEPRGVDDEGVPLPPTVRPSHPRVCRCRVLPVHVDRALRAREFGHHEHHRVRLHDL